MLNTEKIVLGSGKLYTAEFTGEIGDLKALIQQIAVEENLLGLISGGATVEYKPEYYEAKDDLGIASKTVITNEDASMKSGVMTWNGNTLKKICATARVTEENGLRIVKIGGVSKQDGKDYMILFVHEDAQDGNTYVLIVGSNQSGFSFAFAKDKETVIDVEFKAKSLIDNEGTKIIYAEDIPVEIGTLSVTSAAGTNSGETALTVTPPLDSGNSYMVKTAATVALPNYGDVCNTIAGFTTWDGSADIIATTGNEIVVVEVDSGLKAVKAGKATVTAKV